MKLKEFQSRMIEQNIDLVFLATPDQSVTYFTQLSFSKALLLVYQRTARLLITPLDLPPERLKSISTSFLDKDWENCLLPARKIGINYRCLTISYLEKLKKKFPASPIVDVSEFLEELRLTKTASEIRLMGEACKITDKAFNMLVDQLSKHKVFTEQDAANVLETEIKNSGGQLAFPTIVASGKHTAIPHHITSTSKLRKGFLVVDFGAQFKNYCSDMTRTLYLGHPTKPEREYYFSLLNSQQKTVTFTQPGKSFFELEQFSRKNLGRLSNRFIHSLGHGIGLEVHEPPVFSNKKYLVRNNIIFTVEPGVYFAGKFGLRIEDTVLFREKPYILTKASREWLNISF